MCSTLRCDQQIIRIGGEVVGTQWRTGRTVRGRWAGFIREEKLEWWRSHTKLVPVEVHATSFGQGDIDFDIPSRVILAYQLTSKVWYGQRCIGLPGEIKIITRSSGNEYEASIHNRWPVIKTGKERVVFYFQPWDVPPMPTQLPLFKDKEEQP